MQHDLFGRAAPQVLDLGQGALLDYHPAWLAQHEAEALQQCLSEQCIWQQPHIIIGGRRLPIPRLQSWYGEPEAVLRYSGQTFQPAPWLPELQALRMALQTLCGKPFNSVLVNLYRDGNDSVSWHADDERELGDEPLIASLSLGATRKFSLKPKAKQHSKSAIHLQLGQGDLVVMRGATQRDWLHAIPKTQQLVAARINLTFRWVKA